MNILLSNDDGIYSQGLLSLAKKLSLNNKVLVVAPDGNRSACSHSLTIAKSVKLEKVDIDQAFDSYALSGTPADCVKFSKIVFRDFNTDIVISGINKGHNLGSDILYSGTVSIALEASFFGHVSFAVSSYNLENGDYDLFADYTAKIIEFLLPLSEKGDVWNINFPDNHKKIQGVKLTSLGKHIYSDNYVEVAKGEYLLSGEPLLVENEEDCDIYWCEKGYITVTPILFNKTDYKKLGEVKEKCEQLL